MLPQLDLPLLHSFVAAVDCMSFTKAAARVHRSPATLSMQIAKLEERLGRPLFIRDTRNLTLTPAGEEFLSYARRLIRLHDEAVAAIRRPDVEGTVTLGAPDDYIAALLPPVLRRFGTLFPRVELNLVCAQSTELLPKVANGEVDMAVVSRTGRAEGELIRREAMVWIASEDRQALMRSPLPVALFEPGSQARAEVLAALSRGNIRYRSAYSSFNLSGLLTFVEAGLAVAAVAESSAPARFCRLGEADGLPKPAALDVILVRSRNADRAPCQALAEVILGKT